jgi:hypothetical protein
MTSIKSSSSVPFTPVTVEQPTAVEVTSTPAEGTLTPLSRTVRSQIDANRQISEAFLAGNLLAMQFNEQLNQTTSVQNAEASLAAVNRPEAMKLPNVFATVQGNTLTMTGELAELSQFFMKAALDGKSISSLTMELPMLNESGIPIGTQLVRLTNAMISSFENIDGLDRPLQKCTIQFENIESLPS